MRVLDSALSRSRQRSGDPVYTPLEVECLEERAVPSATAMLNGTTLAITGDAANDRITVARDVLTNLLIVQDFGQDVGRFDSAAVTLITVNAGDGNDLVDVGPTVTQDAQLFGEGGLQRFAVGGDMLRYRGSGNAVLNGGDGDDRLLGGPGNDTLIGGPGNDILFGDGGANTLIGGAGSDTFFGNAANDTIVDLSPEDRHLLGSPPSNVFFDEFLGLPQTPPVTLTAQDVDTILQRATAATSTNDGIMAIVDRSGRILGVRLEDGVIQYISTLTPGNALNPDGTLQRDFYKVFAVDGAVAKARTAAFLANDQAPLTSRTFQKTAQTTVTQREIESIPSITDVNSTLRGPGFVAPLTLGNHFPEGVAFTPQVDQFAIEHTNRDSIYAVGFDNVRGANNGQSQGDDIRLQQRFNVNPDFIPTRILTPGQTVDPLGRALVLSPMTSYGEASGVLPHASARGLGTQPGGIPIYKRDPVSGQLIQVGAIGTFFPGKTGFATEENSALDFATFDPSRPDRTIEAEYIGFAAAGGSSSAGLSVGALGGVSLPTAPNGQPVFDLPSGRIDLVGITLDVFGPKGNNGPQIILAEGTRLGTGPVNGALQPLINPGLNNLIDSTTTAGNMGDDQGVAATLNGTIVPEGFLVEPHAAADGSLTAFDVRRIIFQGVQEALITRAAIRLPFDSNAVMVVTVTSKTGEILGQFRMPDSTIFSIDVSTAKARNAAYYADPTALQPIDQVPGVPAGVAFTARTFRFLSLPRFPEGLDGAPPGAFSQLNDDPGIDRTTRIVRDVTRPQQVAVDVRGTGLQVGPRLPANRFISVFGFDSFNPGTNFRDMRTNGVTDPNNPAVFQNNLLNRDGIVFFPGSSPAYKDLNGDGIPDLVGGVGASGDGVDQDDIVTAGAVRSPVRTRANPSGEQEQVALASLFPNFEVPANLRADAFFVQGVRLPFQKFNRQPNINPVGSAFLGNPLEMR
jgi:uncharacterized protein GlcG (DUF336 family)